MRRSIAIIGAGIGAEHLAACLRLPERYAVHSLCDLDFERGATVAARHPGVTATTDFDAILSDPSVDIIDICLPPHLHFDACMRALDAGKAVICEKPLTPSLSETDALIAKVRETGGFLSPVFQYRYGIGMAQLRAIQESGLAGRPLVGTLETHWNRGPGYYAIPWRGTWAGERGGAVLGHAIHIHDLLTSVLGPVAQVSAMLATRVNEIETEDCAALSLRMETGALVTSSITLGAADDSSRMRLCFEGVTVESDHAPYSLAAKPWTFTARAPRLQSEIDAVLATIGTTPTGYDGMFAAIADALDGAPGREVTIQDGRRSVELVTAIYASARSGAPVTLPLDPDHPYHSGWPSEPLEGRGKPKWQA